MKQPYRRKTYIREWRKYRGMTGAQLAERIGMSEGGLSMLERGQRGYTQDSLEAIALALQTDAAALLTLNPGQPADVWAWLAKHGQIPGTKGQR